MRLLILLLSIILSGFALADTLEFTLMIKNHQFTPTTLAVPSEQKIKLIVDNQDATAEEFESYSLNREKVIPGKNQSKIFIGPLKPGVYDFFGDFHQDTAKGKIIAK